MKAKGNGSPQQCVDNLLKLVQYEVPYARLKGMPPSLIDKPKAEGEFLAKNHATWLIENYEPRVTLNKIDIKYDAEGLMYVLPDITINEE